MPDKVLVYSRFPKAMTARFAERFDLMMTNGKPPSETFGASELSHVRAIITSGSTPMVAKHMDVLPALKAIICYGTGYDGVDLAAASARGIAVGHSPAANAAAVADLAITLMLAVTRRLLPADAYVRSGDWAAAKPSPQMAPRPGNPGRRVGVYGMGAIGRKIAARAAAFETEVAYFSRSRHDVPYRYVDSLAALTDWCDVLIVAVRAGADTHHVIDADILRRLGPDGTLVNISRGSAVDEAALVAALANGTIAGAGLDVFETEPLPEDSFWWDVPNLIITPHTSCDDSETYVESCTEIFVANVKSILDGGTPRNVVSQELEY